MKKTVFLIVTTIFSGILTSVYGQVSQADLDRQKRRENNEIIERQVQEGRRNLGALDTLGNKLKKPERTVFPPELPAPTEEQKTRLNPDPADANRYAVFLSQKRTGLVKLFSDVGCEDNYAIVRADEKCIDWIPTSANYSFRKSDYRIKLFADIKYKQDAFISEGLLSQGIIVALGDIPLEQISLNSKGMAYLVSYQPSIDPDETLKQYSSIAKGVNSDGYFYRNTVKATENNTYAVRINAYRTNNQHINEFVRDDKRIDIIVAFRVVRKNSDGSITLLWRELQRQESPKLKVRKKEDAKRIQPSN